MYDNINLYQNVDIIFKYLTIIGNKYGLTFDNLYIIHIVVMALFCSVFISYFSDKVLMIIFLISIFRFVDYANQIRYYFGFFIALNSLYFLVVCKKRKFGIVLAVISILSHSSLIILYVIPLITKFLYRIRIKHIILFNIIIYISIELGTGIITYFFPHFIKYFINPEVKSSLLGGLFESVPALIMGALILFNHNFLKRKESELLNSIKYKFLYTTSIFSILLVSSGFIFRIITDRYVFSFIVVWIITLIFSLGEYTKIQFRKSTILLSSFLIIIWFYFSSYIFFGSGFYLKEVILMLGTK